MAKNIPCESRASLAKEDPNNPVRLLVSWSPSSTGTEAIEYAAWLARSTKVCIRVISTISVPRATTVFTKHGGKYKKWFKKEQAKCEQSVLTALKAAGVDNSQLDERPSVLLAGPSRPQLLTEMATEFCADAILLGANQSAPKGKFFAGSTADALLHFPPFLSASPRATSSFPSMALHASTSPSPSVATLKTQRCFMQPVWQTGGSCPYASWLSMRRDLLMLLCMTPSTSLPSSLRAGTNIRWQCSTERKTLLTTTTPAWKFPPILEPGMGGQEQLIP